MTPFGKYAPRGARLLLLTGLACATGCGGNLLVAGSEMELVIEGLSAVDPATVGEFEVWVHLAGGTSISVGRVTDLPAEPGHQTLFPFEMPVDAPVSISVTLEPPGDDNDEPSPYVLLAGQFTGDRAMLTVNGQVTTGEPLEPEPGAHSLFTTSNNVRLGYPSFERSGIWMFSMRARRNKHGTREVRLTQLQPSWMYEGWIVRDFGTADELWISFGKYRPDFFGLLTSRDDTGSGPYSGDEDYLNAGVEDVPGDEYTTSVVADQLGVQLPGNLEMPILLDEVDPATGVAVWTHIITIEPAFDEDEPFYTNHPFILRPYRNPIGEGRPSEPRVIQFIPDNIPTASAGPVR